MDINHSTQSLDYGALLKKAAELVQMQEFAKAELIYVDLLSSGQPSPQILVNLSVLCGLMQRSKERFCYLDQALQLEPTYSPAWFDRGMAFVAEKNYHDALSCFQRSLDYEPIQPMALAGRGLCLGLLGEIDAAIASYCEAVDQGLHAVTQTFFYLGRELCRAKRYHEAIRILRKGVDVHGAHIDSLLLIAQSLASLESWNEAEETLQYAISKHPQNEEALSSYGQLLLDRNRLGEAKEILELATKADCTRPYAFNLLGLLYLKLGSIQSARIQFDLAHANDPCWSAPRYNIAYSCRLKGELGQCLAILNSALPDYPCDIEGFGVLMVSYSIAGRALAARMLSVGEQWWANYRLLHRLCSPVFLPSHTPRIRVGIVSSLFYGHSVSRFLLSYLDNYDRDLLEIEAISSRRLQPRVESGLRARVSDVITLADLNDSDARHHIRERSYDLIIDTNAYELGSTLHLLCERCAPVQCHYIGYQASLALDTIDYFIGDDEIAADELQDQFVERLWRLPRPWLASTPLTSIPHAVSSRFGEQSIVLGSFNQIGKIRQETLLYWAEALNAVRNSVLVIKDRYATDLGVKHRISSFLTCHGIDPSRLCFLGHEPDEMEHLLAYNSIDIALDTTPWSSATTGFDALSMGVPLVAIRGSCLAARMSSSLVKGIGRPEWVATNHEEFGEIVAHLAADVGQLRECRPQLQQAVLNSPLFDPVDLAFHLDQALLAMVENCRLQP